MTKPEVRTWASYFVKNSSTLRKTAAVFGISKSKLHAALCDDLDKKDVLYKQVHEIFEKNKAEKHIRGGMATKKKYEQMKKNR